METELLRTDGGWDRSIIGAIAPIPVFPRRTCPIKGHLLPRLLSAVPALIQLWPQNLRGSYKARAGYAGREASNTIQNVDFAIVPSKNVPCVSHWHSFLAPSLVTAPDGTLSIWPIWRARDFRPSTNTIECAIPWILQWDFRWTARCVM